MTWLTENWQTIAPVVALILPSIVNGLSSYPSAPTWLHKLLDMLSFVTRKNAEGSLKLPGTPSRLSTPPPN